MTTEATVSPVDDPEWRRQRAINAGRAGGAARNRTEYHIGKLRDRAADLTVEEVAELQDIITANVRARAFEAGQQ